MILPFQGNSSPSDIRQQAEHLLHEYELDDKTLQEAPLKQHKIFQNFPTIPAPAAPNASPLPTDTILTLLWVYSLGHWWISDRSRVSIATKRTNSGNVLEGCGNTSGSPRG